MSQTATDRRIRGGWKREQPNGRQYGGQDSRRVRLESQSDAGGDQAAAEDVHGPLPALGLGLLAGLDAPEPAGGRIELLAAAAALSSGRQGEVSCGAGGGGGGLADAAHGAQGRGRVSDEGPGDGGPVCGSGCADWGSWSRSMAVLAAG